MLLEEELRQRLNSTVENIKQLNKDKKNEFQNYDISLLNLQIEAKVYANVLELQYNMATNKILKISENEQ